MVKYFNCMHKVYAYLNEPDYMRTGHTFIIYPSIAQNTGRREQWNTDKRIAFSVSPQCDFPDPYHACLTCKLISFQ